MGRTTIAALEQGLWRDGALTLEAELRAVTGDDELASAELPAQACMAERATVLLSRTITRLDDLPGGSRDVARSLSVGDRERLLLELHALSYGPVLDVVGACRRAECGEQFEISMSVRDLIRRPEIAAAAEHVAPLGGEGGRIRFRLPTGADQEESAVLARRDLEQASRLLLDRCVIAVEEGAAPDAIALRELLAERLSALDPQAETIVEVACPACAETSSVLVDAGALIFGRMASARRLMSEVDRIARAYHWSEAEILALPVDRRRAYLGIIADMETAP